MSLRNSYKSTNMEINSKEQITQALESKYELLINWFRSHADDKFEIAEAPGKWSAGQHADHLIKSTQPLRKALAMPKFVLKNMFGKNNRDERTYDIVVEKYKKKLAEGGKASGQYIPKKIENTQKEKLLQQLEKELKELIKIINKWEEGKMSIYLLPHPLLGKMTVREMLLFTVYHTEHHYNILRERFD
ncbi:MAG TPA: DinB family protein [Bacteroidetes bacterium]|nr:DinB family protein [Bacteroidota bacterium]